MSQTCRTKECLYIEICDTSVLEKIYRHLISKSPTIPFRRESGPPGAISFTESGELVFHDPDLVQRIDAAIADGLCLLVQGKNPGVDVRPLMKFEPAAPLPLPDVDQGTQTQVVKSPVERRPPPTQPDLICPCTGP